MSTATTISAIDIAPLGLVVQGTPRLQEWIDVADRIGLVTKSALWLIGDFYLGVEEWGRKYDGCEQLFGVKRQTAMNATRVSRNFEFSRRRENLSWSHHSEVCGLSRDDQEAWLDLATDEGWTQRDLRCHIKDPPPAGELEAALDLSDIPVPAPHSSLSRAMEESKKVRDTFIARLNTLTAKPGVFTLESISRVCGEESKNFVQAKLFIAMAEIHPSIDVIRTFGKKGLQQFQFRRTACVDGHQRIRLLAQRIAAASLSDASVHADAEGILNLLGG